VVTLSVGGLAACAADTTNPFAPLGLELSLTPPVDTIFVGDTLTGANSAQFTVSATSFGSVVTTPAGIEWTTSDPTVASVNSSGVILAQGLGSATIKARINSSTADAIIVVAPRVTRLTTSISSFTNFVGDTVQFTASALDRDGVLVPGTAYTFTSDDPTVATVTSPSNRTARVVFLKTGLAKVTVRASGKTASVSGTIQVRPVSP
jgi:uncharacterized protein YjdB